MFPQIYQELGPRLLSMGYELEPPLEETEHWCWLLREEPLLQRVIVMADATVDTRALQEIVKAAITKWRKAEGLFRIGIISACEDRDLSLLSDITWIGAIWMLQNAELRLLYSEGRWEAEDSLLRRHIELQDNGGERVEHVHLYDKPRWTYLFLGVNILIFLVAIFRGGTTNSRVLLELGAKDSARIWLGEYWRLISPIFLHQGFPHLFFNSVALFQLGPVVERLYGGARFWGIYLFAGIWGVMASVIGLPFSMSVGASGAIFGLLGALIYFSLRKPRAASVYFGQNLWIMLGINLVLGFSVNGIDNYGHIGGLIGGFLLAGFLGLGSGDRPPHRNRWGAGVLAATAILIFFSLRSPANAWHIPYDLGRTARYQQDYDRAIDQYTLSLRKAPNNLMAKRELSRTCLIRGEQLMRKGQFHKAIEVLKKGVVAEDLWQLHFDLGVSYFYLEQVDDALREMKKADKLEPNRKDIRENIKIIEGQMP